MRLLSIIMLLLASFGCGGTEEVRARSNRGKAAAEGCQLEALEPPGTVARSCRTDADCCRCAVSLTQVYQRCVSEYDEWESGLARDHTRMCARAFDRDLPAQCPLPPASLPRCGKNRFGADKTGGSCLKTDP